jgi:dihydroorotate dehydrogenase
MAYRLLRPLLFALEPETAHHLATAALNATLRTPRARAAARARFHVVHPSLHTAAFGLSFPNPVGLAAGFDKGGTSFNALAALGFGFVEIGTVTALAQPGNPRPRLFRLSADGALLNRMGFNNPGAAAVAERLSRTPRETVLGVNLGKSRATPLEEAQGDYLRSLDLLEPYASYVAVNVSSPNTPGLRGLQEAAPLRALLRAMTGRARELAAARGGPPRPILVKIAPDLDDAAVEEAAGIAAEEGIAGIIATNTTVSRDGLTTAGERLSALGDGGISGPPLARRAREVVALLWRASGGRLPIVGVGGISGAEDAWRMVLAGATLVQLWTALVYSGPGLPREIARGLVERLAAAGAGSLSEVVGADHR